MPDLSQRDLLENGLCRPHSWAFDITTNQIVETTIARDAYFGVTNPFIRSERQEISGQLWANSLHKTVPIFRKRTQTRTMKGRDLSPVASA